MIKKTLLALCALCVISTTIPLAFAAEADQPASTTTPCVTDTTGATFDVKNCLAVTDSDGNPIQTTAFDSTSGTPTIQIILNAIVFITKIISSIAVLILVIAGLLMITSMHKEQQITRAKEMFVGSLIGLIITFTAYILATFVQSLFYT